MSAIRPLAVRGVVGAAALAASLALALAAAPAADAHVKVATESAAPGASTVLTFTVPVESATARTVGVTVQLPADHPFTSVLTEPVPGWKTTLVETKLPKPLKDDDGNAITEAVTRVTWTATAGGLAPGEFGRFPVKVGPLPASGTVFFPTAQKYSDGTETDWAQQAQGGAEAEHPAPSIAIARAAGAAPAADVQAASASAPAADSASRAGAAAGADAWAVGFGIAGVVVALSASAVAALALRRARS